MSGHACAHCGTVYETKDAADSCYTSDKAADLQAGVDTSDQYPSGTDE